MHSWKASRCHHCHRWCTCSALRYPRMASISPHFQFVHHSKSEALHSECASYAYLASSIQKRNETGNMLIPFHGIFANGIPVNRKFKNQIYRKRFSLCQSICFLGCLGTRDLPSPHLPPAHSHIQSRPEYLAQTDTCIQHTRKVDRYT